MTRLSLNARFRGAIKDSRNDLFVAVLVALLSALAASWLGAIGDRAIGHGEATTSLRPEQVHILKAR